MKYMLCNSIESLDFNGLHNTVLDCVKFVFIVKFNELALTVCQYFKLFSGHQKGYPAFKYVQILLIIKYIQCNK